MTASFTTLASGSGGNASLLELDGFGLLVDFGLSPRTLSARLAAVGRSWANVHAAVLTHTHGDHWKDLTLAQFRARASPFTPTRSIWRSSVRPRPPSTACTGRASPALTSPNERRRSGRACISVRSPSRTTPTPPSPSASTPAPRPAVRPTGPSGTRRTWGSRADDLAEAFAGVSVLALEYNHDERLQRASARPQSLIDRVLGSRGHLSNRQAAEFTRRVALGSGPPRLETLVQLHLSRECNTRLLASQTALDVFNRMDRPAAVVTARQDAPSNRISLADGAGPVRVVRSATSIQTATRAVQPRLPGFDG